MYSTLNKNIQSPYRCSCRNPSLSSFASLFATASWVSLSFKYVNCFWLKWMSIYNDYTFRAVKKYSFIDKKFVPAYILFSNYHNFTLYIIIRDNFKHFVLNTHTFSPVVADFSSWSFFSYCFFIFSISLSLTK